MSQLSTKLLYTIPRMGMTMTTNNKKTSTKTMLTIAGLAAVIAGIGLAPALGQQQGVASISCPGTTLCNGTAGDDVMIGDTANNNMHGLGGNDQMHGLAGNDMMFGDAGNDVVLGYEGQDTVRGGDGTDTVQGDAGTDSVFGDAGNNDRVRQNNSADDPDGMNDTLSGGSGTNDSCYKQDPGDTAAADCEILL